MMTSLQRAFILVSSTVWVSPARHVYVDAVERGMAGPRHIRWLFDGASAPCGASSLASSFAPLELLEVGIERALDAASAARLAMDAGAPGADAGRRVVGGGAGRVRGREGLGGPARRSPTRAVGRILGGGGRRRLSPLRRSGKAARHGGVPRGRLRFGWSHSWWWCTRPCRVTARRGTGARRQQPARPYLPAPSTSGKKMPPGSLREGGSRPWPAGPPVLQQVDVQVAPALQARRRSHVWAASGSGRGSRGQRRSRRLQRASFFNARRASRCVSSDGAPVLVHHPERRVHLDGAFRSL